MGNTEAQTNRAASALVRESSDWGVSVSERKGRKNWTNAAFVVLSAFVAFAALVFVLPMLAALLLNADGHSFGVDLFIVAMCLGAAAVFNILSRRGPRNAMELDHEACELRLGKMNRFGAFVRQRVIPFANIDDAYVKYDAMGDPQLHFMVNGTEELPIELANAKLGRLNDIAAQVREASARAKNAPTGARVKSVIAGLGANYRELGNRVASRIYS